jgi:hypothetical protein
MAVRRVKTYTGETGYVYQYYFVGKRPALADAPEAPASEYVFDVSADRKLIFAVSVFIQQQALEGWANSHGRPLTEAEQYAAAKMRLFRGFDEVENLLEHGRRLLVGPEHIEELLSSLGLE